MFFGVALFVACLPRSVGFIMSLFYGVSFPDADIRHATWVLLMALQVTAQTILGHTGYMMMSRAAKGPRGPPSRLHGPRAHGAWAGQKGPMVQSPGEPFVFKPKTTASPVMMYSLVLVKVGPNQKDHISALPY